MNKIEDYNKKPFLIRALLWDGENERMMYNFLTNDEDEEEDEYVKDEGEHFYIDHIKVNGGLIIKTLEGARIAMIGDYIIQDEQGEYYPCRPDEFKLTYEKVE